MASFLRTKYLTTPRNIITTDEDGQFYPDIMLFPFERFRVTIPLTKHIMGQLDIERFDLLMYRFYGSTQYDDLVMWYNNIEYISRISIGDTIYLPAKEDIEKFYTENTL